MKTINFRTKMISLMLVILAVFVALMFLMQDTIKTTNTEKKVLYEDGILPMRDMAKLNSVLLSKVLIPIQTLRSHDTLTASGTYQIRVAMKEIRNGFLKLQNNREELSGMQTLLPKISASMDNLFGAVENILTFHGDISKKTDNARWQKLYDDFNHSVQVFQKNADAFIALKGKINDKQILNINRKYLRVNRRSNTIMIVGFLIILLLSVLFILDITKKYKLVNKYLTTLSKGDLSEDIPDIAHDELGWILRNVRILQESLRKITVDLNTAAGNLSIASRDLSSSSQNIAQGASEQASSVEEVSSSVEELASNIHQVADNATATEKVVTQLSESTNEMVIAAQKSQEKMNVIAEKAGIISEIAFQTNILALNAAVEAARAGEHGRGFGVVAVEVGKLAERSKKASSEIESLIRSSVEVIENGGKIMRALAPEVNKTANMVKNITEASMEQKLGADQINDAIQQLNEVTQQNAAASEEIATSAEELSAQADRLLETQAYFKLKEQDKMNNDMARDMASSVKKKIPQTVITGQKNSRVEKGVNIDLGKPDSLDDDYERF